MTPPLRLLVKRVEGPSGTDVSRGLVRRPNRLYSVSLTINRNEKPIQQGGYHGGEVTDDLVSSWIFAPPDWRYTGRTEACDGAGEEGSFDGGITG